MAQSLSDILAELDAGYNPSRDLINQQLTALPGQSDTQIAGLKAQQGQAFNDITNGARDRGMGFSGIPLGEQATYTSGTFLPAVAKVYESQNSNKNTLLDALNNINLDQRKTALGIQSTQQQMDFQREQAAAAQRASAAANTGLAGLFGGGSTGVTPPQAPAGRPDPYAAINKQNAATALKSLLSTKNVGLIGDTIRAIQASAQRGNVYDQYKFGLLQSYLQPVNNAAYNPAFANLIKQAMSYKAPTTAAGKAQTSIGTDPAAFIRQQAGLYGF